MADQVNVTYECRACNHEQRYELVRAYPPKTTCKECGNIADLSLVCPPITEIPVMNIIMTWLTKAFYVIGVGILLTYFWSFT